MKSINLLKSVKNIKRLIFNINIDHIGDYAAQCSYYTILSFIPFIILVITLIQYTNLEPKTLFDVILKVIPSSMSQIVIEIVKEVYSKSVGTISISIIFTILSAGKGLFELTKGLQDVYNIERKEDNSYIFLRFKVIIETILFIMLIVFGLVILVFGNSIVSIIKEHFNVLVNYDYIINIFSKLLFTFIIFLIFLLLYKYMPKHKVTFRSQISGAAFSSLVLNIVSIVFSKYLYIFKGFSLTYGSLTTLMLIMMWTYSCFYIVFLGAEINKIKNSVNNEIIK